MQVALFSVVWGITVMHRCCGVYDLWFLRVAIAAPNSLPTCVCVCMCQGLCPHVLLSSVCGGGATGVRDRGERDAWANPPCAPRCCYCLLSPTLFGWMSPTCRRCGCPVHVVCINTVWMTLLLWLSVMPVTFVSYSYSFFVWWSVFGFNSIQLRKKVYNRFPRGRE
ncbi:putative retrotransposon hot spot protein (RHS) [Trypanosoma cruzi]|uniref:Putative retrotransposon hot spot protein (RHS) n=1 Tax=Trypanosoma cruzi TaxID=5693 RepID=A0A2V2V4B5_TRYCR|nr:putative retrotransposon hot spot protein (RHS) [Trypanosoma cruzi]